MAELFPLRRLNTFFLVGLALLASGVLAACDTGVKGYEIPAQLYATRLAVNEAETGSVVGRILFPSEYMQRSTRFLLDQHEFVTNPDGRFRIANVPAGPHRLRVHVQGFDAAEVTFSVAPERSHELAQIALKPAHGVVLGRLVDDQGESAAGVTVRLHPYGSVTATDSDGIFQFIGVASGSHELTVDDGRFRDTVTNFRLQGNEQRNLGIVRVQRLAEAQATHTARLNER